MIDPAKLTDEELVDAIDEDQAELFIEMIRRVNSAAKTERGKRSGCKTHIREGEAGSDE